MAALFGHKVENADGSQDYILPEACQSTGTKRMVELESLIYEQLNRQAFLCIDEIEASMHPNLMEYILSKFVNTPDNQSRHIMIRFLKTSTTFSAKTPYGLQKKGRTATRSCSRWLISMV